MDCGGVPVCVRSGGRRGVIPRHGGGTGGAVGGGMDRRGVTVCYERTREEGGSQKLQTSFSGRGRCHCVL